MGQSVRVLSTIFSEIHNLTRFRESIDNMENLIATALSFLVPETCVKKYMSGTDLLNGNYVL